MRRFVAIAFTLLVASHSARAADEIRSIGQDEQAKMSHGVVVSSPRLVWTTQLAATDRLGGLGGKSDARSQTQAVLQNVQEAIQSAGSEMKRLVRLGIYVAREDVIPVVENEIAAITASGRRPAVTWVVTPLRSPQALVAMDAIAAASDPPKPTDVEYRRSKNVSIVGNQSHSATAPIDRLVFVSGQAEPGEFRESIGMTMKSLGKTLEFAGSRLDRAVQIKVFMKPIAEAATVERIIGESYPAGLVPPISFVEWTNSGATEIEIAAWNPKLDAWKEPRDTVRFLTPPWMPVSPVYSKVAVVESRSLVFLSSIYGKPGTNAESQVRELFATLKQRAEQAGGDLRHLVKATYYITDDASSAKLNSLRPEFYNPQRPPTASKATVAGVGAAGHTITAEVIAVPRVPTTP